MDKLKANIPRIMLVATGSGAGKTTITCGILKALVSKKKSVLTFKCGPDYIDPMFHSKITGTKSRNLDIFMCGEETVKFIFAKNARNCDISIIEGVMGMYDGLGFDSDYGSANHIAMLTDTPQILIVNVKGMSLSVLPTISGFINFKKNNIKGVILNNCSKAMYPSYKKMIEEKLAITAYGYFPGIQEATIESRHLGLITADEVENINQKLDLLGKTAEECIDFEGLIALSKITNPVSYINMWQDVELRSKVRIGVAKDKAFCFCYEDNIDLLKKFGAEIVYFSPMADRMLPPNLDGLILYGGYPEEHAQKLSENKAMLKSIKNAIKNKLPTIAECGGFMYLFDTITDRENITHTMAAVIKGKAFMTKTLSRFGYIKVTANADNMICKKGESLNGHEFHYSDSDNNGSGFIATKSTKEWECIHISENLFAGYPHFHFGNNKKLAANFIDKCSEYKSLRGEDNDSR